MLLEKRISIGLGGKFIKELCIMCGLNIALFEIGGVTWKQAHWWAFNPCGLDLLSCSQTMTACVAFLASIFTSSLFLIEFYLFIFL